jgi:hypothetical protein
MNKSTLRRADLVTGILLLVVAIVGFYMSWQYMQDSLSRDTAWYKSAGLFPMIITFFLGVCSLLLLQIAKKDGAKFDFLTNEKLRVLMATKSFQIAIVIIGWLAAYIFILIPLLHYMLATFIFLTLFMLYFEEERNPKKIMIILIICICATAALTFGFGQLAQVPLP